MTYIISPVWQYIHTIDSPAFQLGLFIKKRGRGGIHTTYNEKAEYLEKTSLGETAEKVLKDLGKPSIIKQRGDIKEYVYLNPKTEDTGKLERISLCVVYGRVIRTAVSKGNRDNIKETSPENIEAICNKSI